LSTSTTNYNIVKPADNESADITVINENMDIIDAAMKANSIKTITDDTTAIKYEFGFNNGLFYYREVV